MPGDLSYSSLWVVRGRLTVDRLTVSALSRLSQSLALCALSLVRASAAPHSRRARRLPALKSIDKEIIKSINNLIINRSMMTIISEIEVKSIGKKTIREG